MKKLFIGILQMIVGTLVVIATIALIYGLVLAGFHFVGPYLAPYKGPLAGTVIVGISLFILVSILTEGYRLGKQLIFKEKR